MKYFSVYTPTGKVFEKEFEESQMVGNNILNKPFCLFNRQDALELVNRWNGMSRVWQYWL